MIFMILVMIMMMIRMINEVVETSFTQLVMLDEISAIKEKENDGMLIM